VFCGYCVDACPKEAIIMSRVHDFSFANRRQAVVGIEELRQKGPIEDEDLGYRPYY
jgi:formate hydrogenlyase subunit 6/NADH:ubiquinone oxidoreductase subunit I